MYGEPTTEQKLMNEHQANTHRVWALCVTIVLAVALVCITKGCKYDAEAKIALAEQGMLWVGMEHTKTNGGWRKAE